MLLQNLYMDISTNHAIETGQLSNEQKKNVKKHYTLLTLTMLNYAVFLPLNKQRIDNC